MNELIDKVNELKDELDHEPVIKKVKELNKEILKDKELTALIEKYHSTHDLELKKQIYNHKLIKEYKETETDINIIIMKINNSLKKINDRGKCSHENN